MEQSGTKTQMEAGSQMHVLDWLESSEFLSELGEMVETTGFAIAPDAARQPKGRKSPKDRRESVLTGGDGDFLDKDQRKELLDWWLVHKRGAKLPTWDLVVAATGKCEAKALILVEAKAHADELSDDGKKRPKRKNPEAQARSDENHEKIRDAIQEASDAIPDASIRVDCSYQFANRVAFAWKLATMGIPVALIYLGFTGDERIGDDFFADADAWTETFQNHIQGHFPDDLLDQPISTKDAAFWLLCKSQKVERLSPPIEERRKSR